jgi:putative glutamine amidotransferase
MTRVLVTRWEDVLGETIERYWRRLADEQLEAVDVTGLDNPAIAAEWHGLVLTGGVDIDPALYGHERHERVRRTEPGRDEFELGLLRTALARDLPVLAICRGHQLLNVAMGGALLQHIDSGEHAADYRTEGYPSRVHQAWIAPGTRLQAALGSGPVAVNSRHHQAVIEPYLAPGLRVAATTSDGLIEGLESEHHSWVVGVQWHPEREDAQIPGFSALGKALFAGFSAAVREAVPQR